MSNARSTFARILEEELAAMDKADGKTVADKSVKEITGTSAEGGSVSGAPEGGDKPAIEKADGKTVASPKSKEVKGTSGEGAPAGAPEGGNKPAIEKAEGSTVVSTSVSPSKDLKGAQNVACESFVLPHDVLVESDGKKITLKGGTKVMLVKEEAEEGEKEEKSEPKEESEGEEKAEKPEPPKSSPKPPAPPFGGEDTEDDDVSVTDLPVDAAGGAFGGEAEGEGDVISRLADAVDGFADAMHEFLGVESQEEEHGGEGLPPVGDEGGEMEIGEVGGAPDLPPQMEGRNKLRNRRMGHGYSVNEPRK